MKTVYIGLGSNIGDRLQYLSEACDLLTKDHKLLAKSSIFETAPIGFTDQDSFLNQVLWVQTKATASELLEQALDIETQLDRTRKVKWGPRTIDIDLLLYESEIIKEEKLILPHPGIYTRRFVLEPLFELNPDLIIPPEGKSVSYYLNQVLDQKVEKLNFTHKNIVFSI